MPNWCVTQYVINGDNAEIKDFCDVLNNLPNYANGFGKNWLGNLFAYYEEKRLKEEGGLTDERIHDKVEIWLKGTGFFMRGEVCPDFEVIPCLSGIFYDESDIFEPYYSDGGKLLLATCTAWDRSEDFERLVSEHYPSFTFAWSNTDEWGNFHHYHDEEGIGRDLLTRYILNDYQYTKEEFDEFKKAVGEALDGAIEIPAEADEDFFGSGEFVDKIFEVIDDDKNDSIYQFAMYKDI